MLLFLMIPLSLLAFTIALGPVLAMTVIEHHRQRSTAVPAQVETDGTAPHEATSPVSDERTLFGVA
jgi:hypothetical protein